MVVESRPVWGAWIEIIDEVSLIWDNRKSRPVWGAWIEINVSKTTAGTAYKSRPVWGAWIEMPNTESRHKYGHVAPRMGRVD